MYLALPNALHIPDGFLNNWVSLACWVITAIILAIALRNANKLFDERLVPLAGIMGAFIFAGQMLNFPVAGGTSGHMVGALLAFVVLGPWLGLIAMTAVIVLQALLFQDGGLVVMGGNIIVMGIVPGFIGYGVYKLLNRKEGVSLPLAGVSAWVSIMAAALITALLLGFSGTADFGIVVPIMLGVHALIGIGEALITVSALGFIQRARPQLLNRNATTDAKGSFVVAGLLVVLFVVMFAPLASGSPDGLEWVAETTDFIDTAQDAGYQILPDYTIPALGETSLSTILSGVIGSLVVAGVMWILAKGLRKDSPL